MLQLKFLIILQPVDISMSIFIPHMNENEVSTLSFLGIENCITSYSHYLPKEVIIFLGN